MKTEKTQEIYGMKTCLYCKHYKTKIDEFPCADCSQSNNGRMGHSANLWEPVDREENAKDAQPTIKDSGERRVFETGAVRDCAEGKGRCDLLPLDIIAEWMDDEIIRHIYLFVVTRGVGHLLCALDILCKTYFPGKADMALEMAIHMEEGLKKYPERNWENGISIHSFVDSGVRHYLKVLRGDDDENHLRACVWNLMCCIWTMKNKPEMDDLPKEEEDNDD